MQPFHCDLQPKLAKHPATSTMHAQTHPKQRQPTVAVLAHNEVDEFSFYYWKGDVPADEGLYAVALANKRRVLKDTVVARCVGGRCDCSFETEFDGPDVALWNPQKSTKLYFKGEIQTLGELLENNKKCQEDLWKGPTQCCQGCSEKVHR